MNCFGQKKGRLRMLFTNRKKKKFKPVTPKPKLGDGSCVGCGKPTQLEYCSHACEVATALATLPVKVHG